MLLNANSSPLGAARYAITLYFVDALSRTGWSNQFETDLDDSDILPALQTGWKDSEKYLDGGPIFQRPDPSLLPTNVSHIYSFKFGTAWTLHDSGQYVSIAILGSYLVIVLVHTFIVVGRGRTMEAWDSINELLALAWNPTPLARQNELKNCGAGIKYMSTLRIKVKVAVAVDSERLELVPVDETGSSKIAGETRKVAIGVAYK